MASKWLQTFVLQKPRGGGKFVPPSKNPLTILRIHYSKVFIKLVFKGVSWHNYGFRGNNGSLIPSYWQTYTQWMKAAVAVSRILLIQMDLQTMASKWLQTFVLQKPRGWGKFVPPSKNPLTILRIHYSKVFIKLVFKGVSWHNYGFRGNNGYCSRWIIVFRILAENPCWKTKNLVSLVESQQELVTFSECLCKSRLNDTTLGALVIILFNLILKSKKSEKWKLTPWRHQAENQAKI